MKIYKQTDRIELKLSEDVSIKIKPLSYSEKSEIQSMLISGQKAQNMQMLSDATILSVRYALKSIEGIKDSDNNPYQLKFDDDGKLSMDSIEDLLNFELSNKLTGACAAFISGIPSQIDGVEFADSKKKPKKA